MSILDILDLHEDSEETVAGLTDRDDDSDADMAGPTDINDDGNDDHGDGPSPSHELPIVTIPCDPPVTQEEDIRLAEGGLVENLDVNMCEGEKTKMVRVRQGIKTKMKPLSKPSLAGKPHNLETNICCCLPLNKS